MTVKKIVKPAPTKRTTAVPTVVPVTVPAEVPSPQTAPGDGGVLVTDQRSPSQCYADVVKDLQAGLAADVAQKGSLEDQIARIDQEEEADAASGQDLASDAAAARHQLGTSRSALDMYKSQGDGFAAEAAAEQEQAEHLEATVERLREALSAHTHRAATAHQARQERRADLVAQLQAIQQAQPKRHEALALAISTYRKLFANEGEQTAAAVLAPLAPARQESEEADQVAAQKKRAMHQVEAQVRADAKARLKRWPSILASVLDAADSDEEMRTERQRRADLREALGDARYGMLLEEEADQARGEAVAQARARYVPGTVGLSAGGANVGADQYAAEAAAIRANSAAGRALSESQHIRENAAAHADAMDAAHARVLQQNAQAATQPSPTASPATPPAKPVGYVAGEHTPAAPKPWMDQ